ncbi:MULTISPECIES: hypothetical protein, partial [Actinomadura]
STNSPTPTQTASSKDNQTHNKIIFTHFELQAPAAWPVETDLIRCAVAAKSGRASAPEADRPVVRTRFDARCQFLIRNYSENRTVAGGESHLKSTAC